MRIRFRKTATKVFGDSHAKNEDVSLRPEGRGEAISRFVLCDGATSSFAPRSWAECLVRSFSRNANNAALSMLSKEDLRERVFAAAREYESMFPPSALVGTDHATVEAYKRGSSATLLLVEENPEKSGVIRVTAVGDSCAFVADPDGRILWGFPFSDPEEFSTSAYLVTVTFDGLKALFDERTSSFFWKSAEVDMSMFPSGSRLVCATDAVAQWIAGRKKCPEDVRRLLKAVAARRRRKFARFVEWERSRKAMAVDDSTVAVLEI